MLAKENFTYDASIPKSYVVLNDKLVDKDSFLALTYKKNTTLLASHKDSTQLVDKEKKSGRCNI